MCYTFPKHTLGGYAVVSLQLFSAAVFLSSKEDVSGVGVNLGREGKFLHLFSENKGP